MNAEFRQVNRALLESYEAHAPTCFTRDVPALLSWQLSDADTERIRTPVLYVGGDQSSTWVPADARAG